MFTRCEGEGRRPETDRRRGEGMRTIGRGAKAKPRDRVVPSVKGEVVIELPSGKGCRVRSALLTLVTRRIEGEKEAKLPSSTPIL